MSYTPQDIWPDKKSFPDWLPKSFTAREKKLVASFTPHRDGWVRWYGGRTLFIAGKGTAFDELDSRWRAKTGAADAGDAAAVEAVATAADKASSLTLEQLASLFYAFNDNRVLTGKPKRMSEVTRWDYVRTINGLGAVIGPDTLLDDLGPEHFSRYATSIAKATPVVWNRLVAYVEAFVTWGLNRGHFANNKALRAIAVGQDPLRQVIRHDLVKLPSEDLRDDRRSKDKSYTPEELRALWAHATETERLWMGLGLNAAFDNSDLSHLTCGVIDWDAKRADFRRRKRGKIRRVAPFVPALFPLLVAAKRDGATEDDPFFLTPTGLPLQRLTTGGQVDYVAMSWTRLMERAGLRPKPTVIRDPETGKRKMVRPEGAPKADGRGFRSLRTTFPNLAPPGYREEVEIVMGHAQGDVLLDNYLEKHGFARLEYLTRHVWHRAFACPQPLDGVCKCRDPLAGSAAPRVKKAKGATA
jgi:hypothetical protein